jgi:hypothetical protein
LPTNLDNDMGSLLPQFLQTQIFEVKNVKPTEGDFREQFNFFIDVGGLQHREKEKV